MSSDVWNLFSSGSAAQPAHHSQDSSAARPVGGHFTGCGNDSGIHYESMEKTLFSMDCNASSTTMDLGAAATPVPGATSLCLFARLPLETWRQLIGLLSYSDVAACACSTGHEDTKQLLIGYMRRRCCVSTFKNLLVEYGAITWKIQLVDGAITCGEEWDPEFWNESEDRKHFWRRAIEMIFTYEPKLLSDNIITYPARLPYSARCDPLIQRDYIHSCGVLFASKACAGNHRKLQRQFRASYGAPHHIAQPWSYGYRWVCETIIHDGE